MSDPETNNRKTTVLQRCGACAYQIFCGILRLLDIRVVAVFGRCIGYLTWALMPGRRRIVARNMRIVTDPMLRGAKLAALVRRNIVRTCMNMACTFKTGLMTDKEFERSVKVLGAEKFEEMASGGGCVIGCIPHAGNWEVLARIRPLFPSVKRFGSMYRRLDNPLLEEIVLKSRTAYGCEMFSSKKGLKEVFRLAKDGGMLGVLCDQFTWQGLYLPYFGKVTGTTPLPSLIYKRCRGRGRMVAVTTRNTGLGKWEAVLDREISIPDESDSLAASTLAVNSALEEVQRQSILDGFWMHHRWKTSWVFAPEMDEEQKELIRRHTRLPFRVIMCVPEAFEEAAILVPVMRMVKDSRPDMQLTVVCPEEQMAFWKLQPSVGHVVSTHHTFAQLEADAVYKDGPFDVLFMLSENRNVFREICKVSPSYISGFKANSLSRRFRTKFVLPVGQPPMHKLEEYQLLLRSHRITAPALVYADATLGAASASGNFIAPFSTLGKADSWEQSKWKELVSRLEEPTSLLALEDNRTEAETMAGELGIPCVIVRPETVSSVLGEKCHLYAVDGLLPQLAALVGCRCSVIMASRLAAAYAPLGEGHRIVYRHTPCHPCYRRDCDQQTPCTGSVSVDELLG